LRLSISGAKDLQASFFAPHIQLELLIAAYPVANACSYSSLAPPTSIASAAQRHTSKDGQGEEDAQVCRGQAHAQPKGHQVRVVCGVELGMGQGPGPRERQCCLLLLPPLLFVRRRRLCAAAAVRRCTHVGASPSTCSLRSFQPQSHKASQGEAAAQEGREESAARVSAFVLDPRSGWLPTDLNT